MHQKISILSKRRNFLSKGIFGQEISKILDTEAAEKRKILDRMSNSKIIRKRKGDDNNLETLETKRKNWNQFVVS